MRYEAELSGPLGDLNLTSSCANNIEINSRLAAKGEAMAALCRTLGFGPENAMCFGDGTNDISMLRLAGVGVAMENAEPCVKEAADVVTASLRRGRRGADDREDAALKESLERRDGMQTKGMERQSAC